MLETRERPVLALVAPPVEVEERVSAEARFAGAVGEALAGSPPPEVHDDSLALCLFASAALSLNKLDHEDACDAALALRRAILTAGGADLTTEAVPLVVRDRRLALVNLLD
jgi:hypothetical protein